jgi:hypothetical protein
MNDNIPSDSDTGKTCGSSLNEKRTAWFNLIEQWQSSGLSKAAFCRQQGIQQWQFHYWMKSLNKKGKTESAQGFVRVDNQSRGSDIRLKFRNGMEVELDPDFNEDTLKRLISVIGKLC